MWKLSQKREYNLLQAQQFLNGLYPQEEHGAGGDCNNPKCNYTFTPQDQEEISEFGGYFDCPQCGTHQNVYDDYRPGGGTKAGISMDSMGKIGEELTGRLGAIQGYPVEIFGYKNFPIDGKAGIWGLEIKTNHSEAQPRFKIGGEWVYIAELKRRLPPRKAKEWFCEENGLKPALVGVRLNFYTNMADIFFRPGLTDTWIGSPSLEHIASLNWKDLNPFKDPSEVPPSVDLPADDETQPEESI